MPAVTDPNPVQSILDPIKAPSTVKAQAWDAFHKVQSPAEFRAAFDQIQLPPAAKAALWDAKYGAPAPAPAPAPSDQSGVLSRAWDAANKGIIPGDLLTGGHEKQLRDYASSPPSLADSEHPIWTGVKKGLAGAAADTADTLSSFTSPLSVAMLGGGIAGKIPGAIGSIARAASVGAGAAFGVQGAVQAVQGGTDIAKHGVTPENARETIGGAGQAIFGVVPLAHSLIEPKAPVEIPKIPELPELEPAKAVVAGPAPEISSAQPAPDAATVAPAKPVLKEKISPAATEILTGKTRSENVTPAETSGQAMSGSVHSSTRAETITPYPNQDIFTTADRTRLLNAARQGVTAPAPPIRTSAELELEDVTQRISGITERLKQKGITNPQFPELAKKTGAPEMPLELQQLLQRRDTLFTQLVQERTGKTAPPPGFSKQTFSDATQIEQSTAQEMASNEGKLTRHAQAQKNLRDQKAAGVANPTSPQYLLTKQEESFLSSEQRRLSGRLASTRAVKSTLLRLQADPGSQVAQRDFTSAFEKFKPHQESFQQRSPKLTPAPETEHTAQELGIIRKYPGVFVEPKNPKIVPSKTAPAPIITEEAPVEAKNQPGQSPLPSVATMPVPEPEKAPGAIREVKIGDRVQAKLPSGQVVSGNVEAVAEKGVKLAASDGKKYLVKHQAIQESGQPSAPAPTPAPAVGDQRTRLITMSLNALRKGQDLPPEVLPALQSVAKVQLAGLAKAKQISLLEGAQVKTVEANAAEVTPSVPSVKTEGAYEADVSPLPKALFTDAFHKRVKGIKGDWDKSNAALDAASDAYQAIFDKGGAPQLEDALRAADRFTNVEGITPPDQNYPQELQQDGARYDAEQRKEIKGEFREVQPKLKLTEGEISPSDIGAMKLAERRLAEGKPISEPLRKAYEQYKKEQGAPDVAVEKPHVVATPEAISEETTAAYEKAKPALDSLSRHNAEGVQQIQAAIAEQKDLPKEEKVKLYLKAAKALAEYKTDPFALRKALDLARGVIPVPEKLTPLNKTLAAKPGFMKEGPTTGNPERGSFIFSVRQLLQGRVKAAKDGQIPVASRAWNRINEARELAKERPSFLERLAALPADLVERYHDQFIRTPGAEGIARFSELGRPAIEKRIGRPLQTSENPYRMNRIIYGGKIGGQIEETVSRYGDVLREADKAKLTNNLKAYLDMNGYDRAIRIIEQKRTAAIGRYGQVKVAYDQLASDIKLGVKPLKTNSATLNSLRAQAGEAAAEARRFQKKIVGNKVVPEGLGRQEIAAELQSMQQALGPANWTKVQRMAGKVWDLNREAWDMAHDSGLISDDVHQQGIARGPQYIPLHRIMDVVNESARTFGGSNLQLRQQKILQTLEGSERVNLDPLEESIAHHQETIREVQRNEAAKVLVGLRNIDPVFGSLVKEEKLGYKPGAGEGIVGFYDNGKPRIFAMPDYIASAQNMVKSGDVQIAGGAALRFTKSIFQKGTTIANLAFALPNAIRDVQDMATISKAGPRQPLDLLHMVTLQWTKSLVDSMRDAPSRKEFLRSGAAFSTMQKVISPEDFMREHRGGLLSDLLHGRIIKSTEDFNNAIEEATKLTSFKRLKAQGMSDADAAWETRNWGGSPDFGSRGSNSDVANLMFMFLNANVKGISRTFARMAEPKHLVGALTGFTLAALALDAHNSKYTDSQGGPEDDHVSDTDRKNYFYVISDETYQTSQGDIRHRLIKIPKGHVARLLMNPIQDLIRAHRKGQPLGTQTALDFLSTVLPGQFNLQKGKLMEGTERGVVSSLNPMVREPLEQAQGSGGFDTYRGAPIVPRRLQEVDPDQKYAPTTSITARRIAGVVNRSLPELHSMPIVGTTLTEPLRLEHAIRGFTGGLGEQVLSAADTLQGQNKAVGVPLEGDEKLSNTPVVGSLLRRFVGSIQDQREKDLENSFYDMADKVRTTKNTFDLLKKSDHQQALTYFQAHKNELMVSNTITKAETNLSKLRTFQQRITQDPNISDEQKKAKVHQLYELRLKILQMMDTHVRPRVATSQ